MVEHAMPLYLDTSVPEWWAWPRLALLATSFVALLAFGEQLLVRERYGRRPNWHRTLGALALYAFGSIGAQLAYHLTDIEWAQAVGAITRYSLGVLGTVLASFALLQQRATFEKRGMKRFVYDLNMAVSALLLYGVIGQLFVEKSVFFPSTVINNTLFEDITGFPIQLFRAVTAIVLAFSMIRVLRALEVENQQRLEAIEGAKLEEERRSREELARLNAELQTANEETIRLLAEVQQRDAFRGELLQRITTAQESERKRIARELHDGTGQALTGLALGLRGIMNLLRNESADCGPLPVPELAELEVMATNSLGELRHLINDLRPPQLDDMGLVAALRWQVDRFSKRGDIQTTLDVIGKSYALPSEVETMLFRMVQEGLTNIAKHAHAGQARVTVDFQNGLELTVWDDGIGFDPAVIFQTNQPRMAWGLLGMQERASLIGATLTFDSAPNQGTTLTARLNSSAKEAEHGDSSGDC
jgi:signal transduction histidine kinase